MVSKASEDLPEPERPVMTVSVSRGMSMSTFLRLCSRAPRTLKWVSIRQALASGGESASPSGFQLCSEGRDGRATRQRGCGEMGAGGAEGKADDAPKHCFRAPNSEQVADLHN